MAALVAGVQYGLSSHSNFHENKSLIFVKLTDSAQRAIEDYLQNRNKTNQSPTIQFLGNEGQLSFPSTKLSHGNFNFSLSSNQDIEGPQGGFECVQQTGPKNLESLGALPCKMRIQANDDVYETTRHRMHVAEENNKNKCTRVIKANEPIGRKVKVKNYVRSMTSSNTNSNTTIRNRDSTNFILSANQPSKSSSSCKPTSSHLVASRSQPETHKKLTDIMRRPLKERLIHLLALRPFKRPELYDRINREGIREKEKNAIATVLKQIAFMRDNTYHLHRCVWNDVQEDWPFLTEQEKAMLKRRKPQNLTPPGSSDGSSCGSGQSPNSTHPGSPPTITSPASTLLGSKRPGYYQGNDGLPTKRQRISHYRKPELGNSATSRDSAKLTIANNSIAHNWDQLQQRQPRYVQHHQRNTFGTVKSNSTPTSDSEDINIGLSLSIHKPDILNDTLTSTMISHNAQSTMDHINHHNYQQQRQEQDHELYQPCNTNRKAEFNNAVENSGTAGSNMISTEQSTNTVQSSVEIMNKTNKGNIEKERYNISELERSPLTETSCVKVTSQSGNSNSEDTLLPFSESSYNHVSSVSSEIFCGSEYPDYVTYYTTISNSEQRTRYKAEFNAYYKEYRKLHVQVVKISKQFSQLEEELKEKLETNNNEGYEAIKHQILQEYARTKNVKARFYYLHDKLGHIKNLVSEYDAQVQEHSSANNKNSYIASSPHLDIDTFQNDAKETQFILTQLSAEQPISCTSKVSHVS